jgi:hypothetical protein
MADKVKATERLYLNADKSKVVPEGDPEAAFLFATPGTEISAEDAAKYGLGAKKAAAKPADKQAAPAANKGRGSS